MVKQIDMIKALAEADRLMDAGKIPFVYAKSPNGQMDRLAVAPEIMETLGLEQGQSVGTIVQDAILEASINLIKRKIDEVVQAKMDEQLEENFDYRSMMSDSNDTKH